MLTIFSIIAIGVILFVILANYPSNQFYKGPVSDHFDGKVFFNPPPYAKKGRLDALTWMFTRDRKKWPKHVDNLLHPPIAPVSEAGLVSVTFVNHATVLLQTKSLNFLTDPIWSYRASPFSWLGPARARNPGVDFSELPNIDVVLLSHNHYDHFDVPTLIKLNQQFRPLFIVPLGNKHTLVQNGITNIIELDWWQKHSIGQAVITLLPSQHWSARWLNDECRALWGAYGIEVENQKIYFAGDTGYSNNFLQIPEKWGTPNIAFLPIGAYAPEWFMRRNHLNPAEAVQAHLDLQAKHSIGIHFGTFQLSDEAIDQPVIDLANAIQHYGINNTQFSLLAEGETKFYSSSVG